MKYKRNDHELLYLVYQNDEEAKNILYQKYKSILCSLTKQMYIRYRNINGVDYDDLYQEACYGFEKAIASFDEEKNILFYTYVVACVRNQLSLFKRSFTRKKDAPLNYAISLQQETENGLTYEDLLQSDEKAPYEICEEMEIDAKIRAFQNQLPFINACVFELRYNGFKYWEISTLLDLPLHRVSHVLQKIREKSSFLS